MNQLIRLLALAFLLAGLSACDKKVEETVFDDQIDALDKAREVEDKLMNRAEQLSKDLEEEDEDKPR